MTITDNGYTIDTDGFRLSYELTEGANHLNDRERHELLHQMTMMLFSAAHGRCLRKMRSLNEVRAYLLEDAIGRVERGVQRADWLSCGTLVVSAIIRDGGDRYDQ